MLLQADLGDRAGAVSTYHHCASVLERELGVVPDPATRRAFQRLMASGDAASASRLAVQPAAARSGFAAGQLVGRSREFGLLQDLWRTAAAGRPSLAVIRGGAGVGKTRIAIEIAGIARLHGAVVAGSQCFGTSGRLALAPVADWLRSPAVQAAAAALDPAWRAEVGRLVPSEEREEREAGSRAMVDAWQRHRFYEGLARALIAVGRPLLLVLDNMQWCDQETLAFITFFLGLASGTPVLVAATVRDDGPDEDRELADWTVRMRATGLLTELSLSPLEAADTARLAEVISGRPLPGDDANLLHATTGGFPLYVIEAVRGGADSGGADSGGADSGGADSGGADSGGADSGGADSGGAPRPAGDLTAVLRNRLEQASPAAREVAGLAAAVGADFTLDLLTEASDLEAGAVVGAVDELWRRRILREFRDGYDFSHDLLRETAYAQVSPPKRWLLHRRVAQALELLHTDDADSVSAQLAGQYARGGRPGRAVAYYRRAAELAAGMFAHAEAIRLHKEALSIIRHLPEGRDRDSRELEVLEAMAAPLNARYGYSSRELQQTLERSIALAETLGRRDSTLTGLVSLWATQFVQGRTSGGYQTAIRALDMVEPESELSGQAHFAVGGSGITPDDRRYDQARAVYNAMIDKHPAAIARCRDVADVIACVRFGRDHGVEIAVRGGGHNAAGLGVWDAALVIDLSLLRSTTLSPENHTVRADAGCTWGDVDHATVAFGMATPSGFLSSTGVGGLTLGGGIGYLSRRFGLTVATCWRPTWCSRTARSSRPASTPTATCSGRCVAAAATSASSRRSPSAATTSARTAWSSPARCSMTSPTSVRSCAGTGSWCRRCRRS